MDSCCLPLTWSVGTRLDLLEGEKLSFKVDAIRTFQYIRPSDTSRGWARCHDIWLYCSTCGWWVCGMATASDGVVRPDGVVLTQVSRLVNEAWPQMSGRCLAVPSSAPDAFGVTPSVSSPVPARPCGVPAGVMTWDDETMSSALPPPRWRGLEEPHQSRRTTRSSSTSMAIEPVCLMCHEHIVGFPLCSARNRPPSRPAISPDLPTGSSGGKAQLTRRSTIG